MRQAIQRNNVVTFYDGINRVGEIDYYYHSQAYIDRAIENWQTGILTQETVQDHSLQMEFDFVGGVEHWG